MGWWIRFYETEATSFTLQSSFFKSVQSRERAQISATSCIVGIASCQAVTQLPAVTECLFGVLIPKEKHSKNRSPDKIQTHTIFPNVMV